MDRDVRGANESSSRGTSALQSLNPNLVHRIIKRTDMPWQVKARLSVVLPVFFVLLALIQRLFVTLLPEKLVVFPDYNVNESVVPLSHNVCSAIVCGMFFLLTLHQLSKFSQYRRHPQKRDIFVRFMLVMMLVFSSYIVSIFGHSTGIMGAHGRVISLPRIVQWALSTPILVSMTVRLSPDGKSWKPAVMTSCAILVQICGWIGTVFGSYLIIAVSWVLFTPVIYYMRHYMSRAAKRLEPKKQLNAKIAMGAILAAWTAFPALWALDWTHAVSSLAVEQLTAAMDFVSKMIMIYVLGSSRIFPFELGEEVETALGDYAPLRRPAALIHRSRSDSPRLPAPSHGGAGDHLVHTRPASKTRTVSRVSECASHEELDADDLALGTEARNLLKQRVSMSVCDDAAMIFSDITNFTSLCHELPIIDVIGMLSELFCEFDNILENFNGTKIKTIGDGYMAAFLKGNATENTLNAVRFSECAINTAGVHLGRYDRSIRVGIHTGEVTYGFMDPSSNTMDVWGSTVNVASRMESMGVSGRIHVSRSSRDALGDLYVFEDRPSPLAVKGVGEMHTSFVLRPSKNE